jgi:general stress protein 26
MPDVKQRIIEMLQSSQLASFATITPEGKPWVRYVFCEGRADMTIRFATFRHSRKVAQIRNNPEVHLTCGASAPADMKPYLQIQAHAEFCTDAAERHGFWKESLKNYFQGQDDPNYGVVVITPYRIELCVPGSLDPLVWSDEANRCQ